MHSRTIIYEKNFLKKDVISKTFTAKCNKTKKTLAQNFHKHFELDIFIPNFYLYFDYVTPIFYLHQNHHRS